jgi:tetratricopeptide (TPR) repeat protein
MNLFPNDIRLATNSVKIYPENIIILYWLAELLQSSNLEKSISVYEKIVNLREKEAKAWMWLGYLNLQQGNIDKSLEGFIQCCIHGDPGANGCYNAGRIYEENSEFDNAIYFYRLSRWSHSQQQADRLEAELSLQNP